MWSTFFAPMGGTTGVGSGGNESRSGLTIALQWFITALALAPTPMDFRRQQPPAYSHEPVPLSIAENALQLGFARHAIAQPSYPASGTGFGMPASTALTGNLS